MARARLPVLPPATPTGWTPRAALPPALSPPWRRPARGAAPGGGVRTTSCQSATMPRSQWEKTGASGSVLTARIVPAARTPTMWLNFPLRPSAMYRRGPMERPVRPIWRARGAHPRSVTFRVAASSAPNRAANGLSCSNSSGLTPAPTPITTSARASVSTSSSRRSSSSRTRPRVPTGRTTTDASRRRDEGVGSTPGRTVTICVALRLVMSATSAPANAGLAATRIPSRSDSATASPTRPQPVAAAARPATSRPKAVLGASSAHGSLSRT